MADQPPWTAYRGAADWLARNTPEGSTVFHTDWDDFPKLFHYNTHNTYIVGLDPDFMRLQDERLYQLWKDATRGENGDLAGVVRRFDSEYVFTDRKHDELIDRIAGSPDFVEVYSDAWSRVYRLR